jgi:hypothetical protein
MHFASCTQVGPGRGEGGVGRLTKFLQNVLLTSINHSYDCHDCHDCHSSWSSFHLAIYWWPDLIYIYRIPEFQEQVWTPKWQFTSYVLVPKWWIYTRFT